METYLGPAGGKLPRLPNVIEINKLTRIITKRAIEKGKTATEVKLRDVINVREYFNFQISGFFRNKK